MQYDGKKTRGLYQIEDDLLLESNLIGKLPDLESELTLETQAFIQEYNRRMINNDMGIIERN